MSTETRLSTSPYPGFRTFEVEESDIFFGRETQTDELLDKLQRHRFLAIVGPSGCGKSSLVRAGMIAALRTGFMCDAGPNWRIVQMRPGERPLGNLAASLLQLSGRGSSDPADASGRLLTEAALRRGPLSLVALIREGEVCADANLLVLVDQFEELFRFGEKVNPDEADAFVSLLLSTAAQKELPIFIVITMRSEYIGNCAVFYGLPEAINAGQYLTPRLTREQCAEAICNPARVFGGEVDDKLVNRLQNDFGPDPNQLPVLQHALARMWQKRTNVLTPGDVMPHPLLTLEDYESIGGLGYALSKHANEILGELTEEQQRIARIVFCRLTEVGAGKPDTRAFARLDTVAEIAGVSIEAVKPVVEAFRRSDRCFLTPREGEPLLAETVLDIGHESLIRSWDKLSKWVDEEAESAEMYTRLKQTALLWRDHNAALWRTPDLERALEWRQKTKPTEPWALRYGSPSDFQLAMEFLTTSEEEQRRQEEMAREIDRRKIRQARRAAVSAIAIAMLVIIAALGYCYLKVWEYTAYYNSFVKVWGAPKGVDGLTLAQVRRRPVSLEIIRKGRIGPVLRMEAVNPKGELTPQSSIGTYLKNDGKGEAEPQAVKWEFTYDSNGKVVQETAYDLRGNRMWGFVYLPQSRKGEQMRRGYYVGRDGYPRAEEQYSGNLVEIEYNAAGFESVLRYRSRGQRPVRGPFKAFGQNREYDPQGRMVKMVSLGPDDNPLNDEFGNAIYQVTRFDALGDDEEAVARDTSDRITLTKEGWAVRRRKYDSAGDTIEESYFDASGVPTSNTDGYYKVTWKRDKHGNAIEIHYWTPQGSPTPGDGGCFAWILGYDDRDNQVKQVCLGSDDNPAFYKDGYAIWTGQYDEDRNLVKGQYFDPEGKPVLMSKGYATVNYRFDKLGNLLEVAYFLADGSPAFSDEGCARITREYDEQGRLLKEAYFGTHGEPVAIDVGYASFTYQYDAFGNQAQRLYFGANGERTIGSELGVAGWKAQYDAGGRQTELIYLDPADHPMFSNEGIAGFRSEYDEAGNERKYSYIGLGGEYTLSDGVAGWSSEFDVLGNETERRYFDRYGKPTRQKAGYAKWQGKYDRRGNILEVRYLDLQGNLTMVPWPDEDSGKPLEAKRAREVYSYNDQNLRTEEAYFGNRGEPVSHPDGYARATHEYDLRGNRVRTRYYGVDGNAASVRSGYHSVAWRFNERGQAIDIRYFSAEGSAVSSSDGFARVSKSYDRYGRLTEQKRFDRQDKPTAGKDRVHRDTRRYDARGQLTEVAEFGPDDLPVINADGYHMVRYNYDPRGNVSEEIYLGKQGEPVLIKKNYARRTLTYDARNQLVEADFFDDKGKGLGGWRLSYDSKGKETKRIAFDASGNPMP